MLTYDLVRLSYLERVLVEREHLFRVLVSLHLHHLSESARLGFRVHLSMRSTKGVWPAKVNRKCRMHALRAHCGSYLYDSIAQQWLTEEERRAMEGQQVAGPLPAQSNGDGDGAESSDNEQASQDSSAAMQWPLFGSPTLSTIRVTSYTDRGGTIVSL